MTTGRQSASKTAWQEKHGSHPSVISPSSPELESPRDLEKLSLGQQYPGPQHSYTTNAPYTSPSDMDGDDMAEEHDPTRHAMKILVFTRLHFTFSACGAYFYQPVVPLNASPSSLSGDKLLHASRSSHDPPAFAFLPLHDVESSTEEFSTLP